MIRDPESAVAASICYLSRVTAHGVHVADQRHPRRCEWCEYPEADLLRMVLDFNIADIDGRLSAAFRRLSPNAQRSLVDGALYPAVAA